MRSPCALWYWVWGCFDARGGFASPGPGLAPAGEVLSCRAARKYPKKRAPQSATPTLRVGAHLGRDAGGVRCGTRCALRASLKQPQRVSSRSMRDFAHATPPPPRPRRSLKGGRDDTGHRYARPPPRRRCAPRAPGRAQRWPVSSSNPFWPYRGAQGVGRARVPQDTRASCSDLPRLSERSA